jgi:hypothetical protein
MARYELVAAACPLRDDLADGRCDWDDAADESQVPHASTGRITSMVTGAVPRACRITSAVNAM